MNAGTREPPTWMERARRENQELTAWMRSRGIPAEERNDGDIQADLSRWANPGRHVDAEVMPDWWFDTPGCNEVVTKGTGVMLVSKDARAMGAGKELREGMERQVRRTGTTRRHSTIQGVIESHMSGYGVKPDAGEIGNALREGGRGEKNRNLVAILCSEADTHGDTPAEIICICVEEKLSLRVLAEGLRNANVRRAQIVDWLNSQGGPGRNRGR